MFAQDEGYFGKCLQFCSVFKRSILYTEEREHLPNAKADGMRDRLSGRLIAK